MADLLQPADRPVLVVEDCDEDFDTILEAVRRNGIRNPILRATDAVQAAQLLPPSATAQPFALVLLDQNLPGTSGCELLRELRREPWYRALPVVIYTTSDNPRDRSACYEAGANAYHVKSVRFEECLQTLTDLLHYWLERVNLPDPPQLASKTD
jgi:CheY-like chemotaxis protein